jgi:uncharacterized repeat protein (TIGR01451 family)
MKFIDQPIFKKLNILLATSLTLVAQSGWLFVSPALADKEAADGTAICAIPGRDGVLSGGGQVNTIYSGTSASVAAGTSSLDLGPSTGASTSIEPGDLLLVIQMQGADINSTNTAAYGDGNAINSGAGNVLNTAGATVAYTGAVDGYLNNTNFTAGNFEYVIASSTVGTGGGTLSLTTPLKKSYSNADATAIAGQRRFQVIRVPQYSSANITTAITAPAWDGSKGGIIAIDIAGQLTFETGGSIDADGKGFRGGGGRILSGGSVSNNTDVVTLSSVNVNASKGEGIVGTPKYLVNSGFSALITGTSEGYPNGSYGRGAPGNAGGGGTDGISANTNNSGGGGGGNGGFGGKGGNTWDSNLPYGGDGGVLFPASAGGQLVLGGGGGAGTINNNTGSPAGVASSGAPGGGIVMVRAGSIFGSGVISANGKTPSPATIPTQDSSGGGGAGGSILVIADSGTASGLTLNANGGTGGSNKGANGIGSKGFHGPGGGGGGGAILASPGAIISVAAGLAGTTKDNLGTSSYGGAEAGEGFSKPTTASPSDAATMISGANCLLKTTKSTSTPGPLLAPGIATYTITVSNPAGLKRPEAQNIDIQDVGLPIGFTHTAVPISPVYLGGATGPTRVTGTAGSTPLWTGTAAQPFKIPPGGSIAITFNADIATGAAEITHQNSATATAKYINTSAGSATLSPNAVISNYNGGLSTNTADDVTIAALLSVSVPLNVDKIVALAIDKDGSGGSTPLASQTPTPGDVLEYTIVTTNPSTVNTSLGVILKDTIPVNTTYVPGSIKIAAAAKTDAADTDTAEFVGNQVVARLGAGATAAVGGSLAPTTSITVKFQVTINDSATLGTDTVSNQAIVASTGTPDKLSNDPATTPSNDPTIAKVGPRLRLVKRITGIRKALPKAKPTDPVVLAAAITPIGGYFNDATAVNDDPTVGWFGGAATYLRGITKTAELPGGLTLAPNDQVEYTIYFLADSATAAQGVKLCDFIPANQTFVNNSLKLQIGAGANTTIANGSGLTGNGFYPTTATFPAACAGTNNGSGAAYVQVGNVPSLYGTPTASYGKFSFLATVK